MSGPSSDFWDNLGIALVILAVCLGIGSCTMMDQFGKAAIIQAKK